MITPQQARTMSVNESDAKAYEETIDKAIKASACSERWPCQVALHPESCLVDLVSRKYVAAGWRVSITHDTIYGEFESFTGELLRLEKP